MISACVDIGTNTALLLIARAQGEDVLVLEDMAQVVRLGEGVDATREFQPQALHRLEKALQIFDKKCQEHGVSQRMSVATSATRDVKDASAVFELCQRYGFPLRVLTGDEEAEYTFRGSAGTGPGQKFVIDIGGGSTEIICGEKGQREFEKSFNVGAVRMTERFISAHPVPQTELERLTEFLRAELAELPKAPRDAEVIAVAGTPTTLAALDLAAPFDRKKVHGYNFDLARLESWVEKLASLTLAERAQLHGMQRGREDVIVAGAAILVEALKRLDRDSLIVSDRGLRYGVLTSWKELNS